VAPSMQPRSVERMVDEQARRWALRRAGRGRREHCPVIAVSRQHGSGGELLARRVAERLGYDLFDRELLHRISESSHLSERMLAALDDRARSQLDDWLQSLAIAPYLSPSTYLHHLTRVVGAIAHHGRAVVVGRGAHLILGPGRALRVLTVAPLPHRIRAVARAEGVDEAEARRRVEAVDAERGAFIRRHFHAEPYDPCAFDLVLNTETLGPEQAGAAVAAALSSLAGARRAAPGIAPPDQGPMEDGETTS